MGVPEDDILGKADALLRRHRAAREAQELEPTADFPVLTEVIDDTPPVSVPPSQPMSVPSLPPLMGPSSQPPSVPPTAEFAGPPSQPPPGAAAIPVATPPPPPAYPEPDLAQLEHDLRLQLLEVLGPEFERAIEAKVQERLTAKVDDVLALTKTVLEAEVRAVIREALAEVIATETERLKIELDLGPASEAPPL